MLRRTWIAMPLLALGLALAGPSSSVAGITVEIAPPAPKVVVRPAPPKSGYVWQEGYWDWNGREYVWRDGTWVSERPGHRWVEHRWVQRDRGWYSEPGRWEPVSSSGPGGPPPPPP